MGYALNAEGSWIGDLLIADTEALKTIPPSEIHVKRFASKKRWTFKKETISFCFHVERAKHCKKGSRYPPLCTKREVTSGKNFNKHHQKKK